MLYRVVNITSEIQCQLTYFESANSYILQESHVEKSKFQSEFKLPTICYFCPKNFQNTKTIMKKILLFTAFVALTVSQSFAQLTERENYDTKLSLGTRPQAGNGVLQFYYNMGGDGLAAKGQEKSLGSLTSSALNQDFLTYKYYLSDDVVLRAGLRWHIDNDKMKGSQADSSAYNIITPSSRQDVRQAWNYRDFAIAGGLEKHFTNSNIFDVYAGGELILGGSRERMRNEVDYQNGDKNYETKTTSSRLVGFGLVTGFNVFVAELPLSIGLEYGLNGAWLFGDKTKVVSESTVGSTSISGEWYEQAEDAFGNLDTKRYSSLSKRNFQMNTSYDLRLSLNIYFSTLANPRNSDR